MTLMDKAQRALFIVRNDPNPIAYDVETSGLDWKTRSIVGYVITGVHTMVPYAWPEEQKALPEGLESIYVPIRHGGGGNLAGSVPLAEATSEPVPHWFEDELKQAFAEREAKGYITVGHNIGFDALFSWKHGIKLGRNLKDTQHQATMLDEHQASFSLDATAKVFGATPKLGDDMYKRLNALFGVKADKKSMEHFWRTAGNDPVVVDYSEGDGYTTLEVYHRQLQFIEAENLTQIMDVENQLIWTLVKMEHRGWKARLEKVAEVEAEIDEMLREAEAYLSPGFNVRSPGAIRALAEREGKTNWPFTATGRPSFAEPWLETWEGGKRILRVRKLRNLCSKFIIPIRDRHIYNGRIHGHLNQLKSDEYGTISGRLSASEPNLQQIPSRDEELASLVRRIFEADEGYRIYEADYSQQEPRLWAHYSRDPYLMEGYNAEPFRDVHTVVAEMVGVSRKYAKAINLGLFYLMGKTTFLKHMRKFFYDMEQHQTDEMHNKWYSNFTRIKAFQNDATSVFKNRGWVRTLLGRRARVKPGDGRFYVASNRIIQGGSADMTKYKLLQMDLYLESVGEDKAWLLFTIHDSILWQALDNAEGEAISKELVRIMTDLSGPPFNITSVPFVADVTSGYDWREVKFGKEEE